MFAFSKKETPDSLLIDVPKCRKQREKPIRLTYIENGTVLEVSSMKEAAQMLNNRGDQGLKANPSNMGRSLRNQTNYRGWELKRVTIEGGESFLLETFF